MCINDSLNVKDEEQVMTDFIKAMEELFPEKSSFEL
jgi:receptor polysaccharide phosphotransferase wefC